MADCIYTALSCGWFVFDYSISNINANVPLRILVISANSFLAKLFTVNFAQCCRAEIYFFTRSAIYLAWKYLDVPKNMFPTGVTQQ